MKMDFLAIVGFVAELFVGVVFLLIMGVFDNPNGQEEKEGK